MPTCNIDDFMADGVTVPFVQRRVGPETISVPGHQPEDMVLLLSDLQCGLRTDTFNADVLAQRLDKLSAGVLRMLDIHSSDRRIPRLWVACGGDFVEGEPYTRRINIAEIDAPGRRVMDALDQKRLVVDLVVEQLVKWARHFELVELVGVAGNHGLGRGKDASSRSNDDLEVYLSVCDRMAGVKNFVGAPETNHFYQVFEPQGVPILLVHGHQVKMWSRTPLYGIINAVTLWHHTIPQAFKVALMGHFHSVNLVDSVGTPVYVGGAFVDDDEYCVQRGLKPSAAQWLLGVHPKYGVTWERRLWLK